MSTCVSETCSTEQISCKVRCRYTHFDTLPSKTAKSSVLKRCMLVADLVKLSNETKTFLKTSIAKDKKFQLDTEAPDNTVMSPVIAMPRPRPAPRPSPPPPVTPAANPATPEALELLRQRNGAMKAREKKADQQLANKLTNSIARSRSLVRPWGWTYRSVRTRLGRFWRMHTGSQKDVIL